MFQWNYRFVLERNCTFYIKLFSSKWMNDIEAILNMNYNNRTCRSVTKKLYLEGDLRRCSKNVGWLWRIKSVAINLFVYNNNCLNKTFGIMVVILLVDVYGLKYVPPPYNSSCRSVDFGKSYNQCPMNRNCCCNTATNFVSVTAF